MMSDGGRVIAIPDIIASLSYGTNTYNIDVRD